MGTSPLWCTCFVLVLLVARSGSAAIAGHCIPSDRLQVLGKGFKAPGTIALTRLRGGGGGGGGEGGVTSTPATRSGLNSGEDE